MAVGARIQSVEIPKRTSMSKRSLGSRGVQRKGSNGVGSMSRVSGSANLPGLDEPLALLMMLLKELSGLRQFRAVWIGGFPERQEFPVSHPRGLVVTQDSSGPCQANNSFWTLRCALQRFLKISDCFP